MTIGNQDVRIVQVQSGTSGAVESRRCELRIDGRCEYRASYADCRRAVLQMFPGLQVMPRLEIPDCYR